jgi:hypothetical protein
MATMIQMKPSTAHATTQAMSTASFRKDEIDPRPVARISIGKVCSVLRVWPRFWRGDA